MALGTKTTTQTVPGQSSGIGTAVGGTVGKVAGSAFGPVGSLVGGLLGGLFGGLFDDPEPEQVEVPLPPDPPLELLPHPNLFMTDGYQPKPKASKPPLSIPPFFGPAPPSVYYDPYGQG